MRNIGATPLNKKAGKRETLTVSMQRALSESLGGEIIFRLAEQFSPSGRFAFSDSV